MTKQGWKGKYKHMRRAKRRADLGCAALADDNARLRVVLSIIASINTESSGVAMYAADLASRRSTTRRLLPVGRWCPPTPRQEASDATRLDQARVRPLRRTRLLPR
jgi:hypothetical protein